MNEPLSPERFAEIKAHCEGERERYIYDAFWSGRYATDASALLAEVERLRFELEYATSTRATVEEVAKILGKEVEGLRALNEQAAALVEAHESDDGSNLCETLAAKIRALLPCR